MGQSSTVNNAAMTQVEQITVSFVKNNVNAACALLNDGSIMTLYVSAYNYLTRQQVTIMP
jgi:spore coat polysaccharide biosynthesis predicted glycosyltransferase SpsG